MRRLAIVVGAAIASHVTALGAGFIWLDHAHIEGGMALAPPSSLVQLFTHGFAGTGYYRPLMSASLSLDSALGGPGGTTVFHGTSIAWHAVAAAMVVLASDALALPRRAAGLAGVLFAVHPLSALVADAIAFRSEAIVTAALLALVWAHLRNRPVLAAAALAVGALTKENAFVLGPLFIGALEIGRVHGSGRRALFIAESAAFVLVALAHWAWAPPWRASPAPLGIGDAVGTRLAALAKSAAAVLMPVDRSICDAFPKTHWWQATSIAGALALAAVAVLAWKKRGITLLLALAVLPILQIVPVTRWWSPHYLYLPFAFVAMHAAAFAERLDARRWSIIAGGLALSLGAVTFWDGRRYESDATLWTREVKHQPACREGQFYLGELARSEKQWDAAALRYEAALLPWPDMLAYVDRGAALQNLGVVRYEQKRFGDARRAYQEALDGTRDVQRRRELTYNLAAATLADGDADEARTLFDRARRE